MTDRVFIRHPDYPDRNGEVSRTAFDHLWSRKGYVIEVTSPPSSEVEVPGGDLSPASSSGDTRLDSRQPPADTPDGGDVDGDGTSATTAGGLNEALDEKAQLRSELEALGIVVDNRWGLKRLRTEAATAREGVTGDA